MSNKTCKVRISTKEYSRQRASYTQGTLYRASYILYTGRLMSYIHTFYTNEKQLITMNSTTFLDLEIEENWQDLKGKKRYRWNKAGRWATDLATSILAVASSSNSKRGLRTSARAMLAHNKHVRTKPAKNYYLFSNTYQSSWRWPTLKLEPPSSTLIRKAK